MKDTIYRDDAIEAVGDWMQKEFGYLDLNRTERLIDALSALPSAEAVSFEDAMEIRNTILFKEYIRGRRDTEAVQGWIPCSERLPNEGDAVLATIRYLDEAEDDQTDPYYTNEVIFLHDGKWMGNGSWVESFGYTKVTAWRPLPTPYKGGDE